MKNNKTTHWFAVIVIANDISTHDQNLKEHGKTETRVVLRAV